MDTETGRVAVTLSRATVPASPALYLRSLLSETFAVKGTARSPYNPEEAGDGEREEAAVPSWSRLEFGTTTNATVVAVKEYGIVLKASAGGLGKKARSAQGAGQLMVCPLEHAPDGVKEGLEVKVRAGYFLCNAPWRQWYDGVYVPGHLRGLFRLLVR